MNIVKVNKKKLHIQLDTSIEYQGLVNILAATNTKFETEELVLMDSDLMIKPYWNITIYFKNGEAPKQVYDYIKKYIGEI